MLKKPFLWLITLYRVVISPIIPPRCRFHPSCSAYAHGAIETHGVAHGLVLSVWRLLRCHPLSAGGYDPVPEKKCIEPPNLEINPEHTSFNG